MTICTTSNIIQVLYVLILVSTFTGFNEDLLPVYLIVTGGLFIGALAISRYSLKFGVPGILGVLLFGLGINWQFIQLEHGTVDVLHTLSLSILLFVAGLNTNLIAIKHLLRYGLLLAFGGVLVSSTVLGGIIWLCSSETGSAIQFGAVHKMPIGVAMLIAACLGSTDAGATMSVLAKVRSAIPERVRNLLKFESSVNDPVATLVFSAVLGLFAISPDGSTSISGALPLTLNREVSTFIQALSAGIVLGVVFGIVARFILNRIVEERSQLLIAAISISFLVYGVTQHFHGSGLIGVYVTGLYLENTKANAKDRLHLDLNTIVKPFTMMTEILVFLMFGLMVDPHDLLPSIPVSIVVALGLMFVARPLSVMMLNPFSPFSYKESILIGWCGLRGAVPLSLGYKAVASIPYIIGVESETVTRLSINAASIIFNVIVLNLLLQGLSLRWLSKSLRLMTPPKQN